MSIEELMLFIKKFQVKDYEDAKYSLSIITKEFKKLETKTKLETIKKIIKESKELKNILNIIIKKLLPLLKNSLLDDFFDDQDEINIIEIYMVLNNINIEINDDELDDLIEFSENIEALGAYINSIKGYRILSKDEERRLCARITLGDNNARDILILHNLKLVVYLAKQYYNSKIDIIDLVQEGNIGLIKAIEKFDFTKNSRFVSYARVVICSFMRRYILSNSNIVSHSEEAQRLKNKYYKLKIVEKMNEEEVFQLLNISRERFEEIKRYFNMSSLSIDSNIAKEDEKPLTFSLIDKNDYFSKGEDEKILLRESILKLLKTAKLTNDEIEIVMLYHGFYEREYTFQEIADNYNLGAKTKYGVSLKYYTSINKIRMCPSLKDFALYMDRPHEALNRVDGYVNYIKRKEYPITQNFNSKKFQKINQKENSHEGETKKTSEISFLLSQKLNIDERLISLALNYIVSRKELSRLSIFGYKDINIDALPSRLKITPELEEEIKLVIERIKKRKELIEGIFSEDYIDEEQKNKLLILLNSKEFSHIKDKLSRIEMIVLILKFGFIENKYFTDEAIASFLGLSESEISDLISKIIANYHDEVITIIDNKISLLSMPPQNLIRNYAYN